MRTKEINFKTESPKKLQNRKSNLKTTLTIVFVSLLMAFGSFTASAHCDAYDGPVIKDAIKALETNDVDLVLKWIAEEQEQEIIPLFNKTYQLKKGDEEVYAIVKKHFFETLVRLHRETEGEPYTGLKPAGSNKHMDKVIREKYQNVSQLNKVKDNSAKQGRAFVEAYVDYTHTVEAMHDIMEHGAVHKE